MYIECCCVCQQKRKSLKSGDRQAAPDQNSAPHVCECVSVRTQSGMASQFPTCPPPWFPYVPSLRSQKSDQRLRLHLSGMCHPTAHNCGASRLNREVFAKQFYEGVKRTIINWRFCVSWGGGDSSSSSIFIFIYYWGVMASER